MWIHTKCAGISDAEYTCFQHSTDEWFCRDCQEDCGMCGYAVHSKDSAIECDKCKLWIHSKCASVSDAAYTVLQSSNCAWFCPKCNHTNHSFFFPNQDGINLKNSFQALTEGFAAKSTKSHRRSTFNRSIGMVSMNINGLRGKKLELQSFLDTEKPEIVALQETKIDSSIKTNELIPDSLGYDVYRKDRNDKGGGTMLLIKRFLDSAPVNKLNNSSESIWCKIKIQGKTHFISSWYRPPNAPHDMIYQLKEQIDNTLKSRKHEQPYIHIMGDFNYPKIDWEELVNKVDGSCLCDSEGQSLIDIMNEASMEQLISFPTRGNNILDLFITTYPGLFKNTRSSVSLSDHDAIQTTLKCIPQRKIRPERKIFQYSKGNYSQMREETKAFSKEKYFNGYHNKRSIEENWKMIKSFIEETTNANIPTKKASKKVSLPWVTKGIRALIRKRDRTHALFKKTKNPI